MGGGFIIHNKCEIDGPAPKEVLSDEPSIRAKWGAQPIKTASHETMKQAAERKYPVMKDAHFHFIFMLSLRRDRTRS